MGNDLTSHGTFGNRNSLYSMGPLGRCGSPRLDGLLTLYGLRRHRAIPPAPARPTPTSNSVAGSGTGAACVNHRSS